MPGKQKGQVVNRPHGNSGIADHFRKYYQLWLLALPGIVLTLMFAYIPMSGLVIIFKDYNFRDGIFGSPWVGFKNFEFFFANFSNAWRATKNTIILNLFYTIFGTVAAVGLAIMFNEIHHKKFLKISQSLSIMPYFISWVVAGGILRALLNYDGGAINNLLVSIGFERLDFYNDPKYWRVILTLCNIWKSAGYNGIIYFSTIAGFDTSLYESAQVDGANLWQRIRYITIPPVEADDHHPVPALYRQDHERRSDHDDVHHEPVSDAVRHDRYHRYLCIPFGHRCGRFRNGFCRRSVSVHLRIRAGAVLELARRTL